MVMSSEKKLTSYLSPVVTYDQSKMQSVENEWLLRNHAALREPQNAPSNAELVLQFEDLVPERISSF